MKKLFGVILVSLTAMMTYAVYQSTTITDIPAYVGGTIYTNLAGTITTNTSTAANVTNLLTLAEALTTNTIPSRVVCQVPATNATVFVSLVGTNAGSTAAVGFAMEKSFDKINWSTLLGFAITGTGTTAVNSNLSLSLGDAYYVRLAAVTNASTNAYFGRVLIISK